MATSAPTEHRIDDARWALVQRVLASSGFARAPRLSEFLQYVCECALGGRTDEISEQQIGVHVFNRPANYNPNDDSIVRSHARLLRQRLELYFEQQGRDEEIRILIPKGRYVPLFEHRDARVEVSEAASAEPAAPAALPRVPWVGRRGVLWAAVLMTCVLGVAAFLRWNSVDNPSRSRLFWKNFFASDRKVLIVPADSALALLEDLTHEPVHLSEYLNRKYRFGLAGHSGWNEKVLSSIAARPYTSMSDLNLAVRLVRLSAANSGLTQIRYARYLQLADLKEGSAVLIGGPRANPWEELFEGKMNFFVDTDPATSENRVNNRSPRIGESIGYSEAKGESPVKAYGLLAFLPGLTPRTQTLIVEGTSSVGTECASDFLFDDVSFSAFLTQISGSRKTPPYFEILLETAPVGGNAQQPQITAYRIVKN